MSSPGHHNGKNPKRGEGCGVCGPCLLLPSLPSSPRVLLSRSLALHLAWVRHAGSPPVLTPVHPERCPGNRPQRHCQCRRRPQRGSSWPRITFPGKSPPPPQLPGGGGVGLRGELKRRRQPACEPRGTVQQPETGPAPVLDEAVGGLLGLGLSSRQAPLPGAGQGWLGS